MSEQSKYPSELQERIDSGAVIEQKVWAFIKELNTYNDKHLNDVAVIEGQKKYTYRKLFRLWDKYAEVFSGLDLTMENGSRVGLLSSKSIESISMFYALNMTGASVSVIHMFDVLDEERWEKMIEMEGITDIIINDDRIPPDLIQRIIDAKDDTGIRNVILHLSEGHSRRPAARHHEQRRNRRYADLEDVLYMEELFEEYAGTQISYCYEQDDAAVIVHTSGTTSGIHKPIPLSDRGFNEASARLLRDPRFQSIEHVVVMMMLDMTAAFGLCDQMNLPLCFGGTLLILNMPPMSPAVIRSIIDSKVSVAFANPMMLDMITKLPFTPDLSSIEFIFAGGGPMSVDVQKRFNQALRKAGSKAKISPGYGLSEIGGAALLSDPGELNGTVGRPLAGVKAKILDEETNTYYDLSDGPRTGVLLLSSPSVSSGRLNGHTFFELEEIDGEQYINTFDLVDVSEDGEVTIIGRMNKFFVNNEGIRFDAGLVESAVAAEPGIDCCGLAPEYDKRLHDTIPVLYAVPHKTGKQGIEIVRNALYNVFVEDGRIEDTNLPSKVVIAKELPLTESGKVSVHAIARDGVIGGKSFAIEPVRRRKKLTDIRLVPSIEENPFRVNNGVPEELEGDLKRLNQAHDLLFNRNKRAGEMESHGTQPGGMEMGGCDPQMFGQMMGQMLAQMMQNGAPIQDSCGMQQNGMDMSRLMQMVQGFMPQMNRNIDRYDEGRPGQYPNPMMLMNMLFQLFRMLQPQMNQPQTERQRPRCGRPHRRRGCCPMCRRPMPGGFPRHACFAQMPCFAQQPFDEDDEEDVPDWNAGYQGICAPYEADYDVDDDDAYDDDYDDDYGEDDDDDAQDFQGFPALRRRGMHGCGNQNGRGFGVMEMLSNMGGCFRASDYDKFYEE